MAEETKRYKVVYKTCCSVETTVLWLDDATAKNPDGRLQHVIYYVEGVNVRSIVSVQPII